MTTSKTTPLRLIGLTHIDCQPVWEDEDIVLFDMYTKDGVWLGSKRTFEYVKDFDKQCKQN